MDYNNLSGYLKSKYGTRLKKICIDGGFTCPNRDGRVGVGGCIFCGERGAGEHINCALSIEQQVQTQLARAKAFDRFIAYFQNFTNTYAPPAVLRERYDAALIDERIKVLAIGTRPDCIDREVVELIASYKNRVDVWVELGLQTSSDRTAEIINRGYTTDVFVQAVELLHSFGIPVVTHLMLGLPEDKREDVLRSVRLLNSLGVEGVKLHSVYVMGGTVLEGMYRSGEYVPLTKEEYVTLAADAIAHLDKSVVIHRVTGDCSEKLLVAPLWILDKFSVIDGIRKSLEDRGLQQGSLAY